MASESSGVLALIIAVLGLILGVANTVAALLKSRDWTGLNFNPSPAIKMSTLEIIAKLDPKEDIKSPIARLNMTVLLRAFNDGNRTSTVIDIRARMDKLQGNECNLPPETIFDPFTMPLNIDPIAYVHDGFRTSDECRIEKRFINVKMDEFEPIKLDCILHFEKNEGSDTRAKLSLGVLYFNAKGVYSIKSIFAGTVTIFGSDQGRYAGIIRVFPCRVPQTVVASPGIRVGFRNYARGQMARFPAVTAYRTRVRIARQLLRSTPQRLYLAVKKAVGRLRVRR